jgi:aminopeptidase
MSDPRIEKLAEVLVKYSLGVQPKQKMAISTNALAEPLALAAYEQALRIGAYPYILCAMPQAEEIFYKNASDDQLDFVNPVQTMLYETYDHFLSIGAEQNTRALTAIDPARRSRRSKATAPLFKLFLGRAAEGSLHWCYTEYPTFSSAQEGEMSLRDYEEFVFSACKLNQPDPVAAWRKEGETMRKMKAWLEGRDQMVIRGKDVDLKMSIKDRTFIVCDGHENFPDGEIFTGPVEDSVEGWIRYRYPAIYGGREVTDVQLWFEKGKVVKEQAEKGQDLLTTLLNTDPGARSLGELGIGTNYSIPQFTKNMLFDEKLGGTIHLAVGSGYPESGSKNESGIHWDMLCDMNESTIHVDGDLFYQNGKCVIGE